MWSNGFPSMYIMYVSYYVYIYLYIYIYTYSMYLVSMHVAAKYPTHTLQQLDMGLSENRVYSQ